MSYILEALKKSEQDRGNGAIPSVQSIHSSSINYHSTSSSIWPWLIGVMLIINALALLYFFVLKSPTNTDTGSKALVKLQNTSELSRDFAVHTPPEHLTTPVSITNVPKQKPASVETMPMEIIQSKQPLFEKTLQKQLLSEPDIVDNTNTIVRNKTQLARPSNFNDEPINHHVETLDFHDLPENIKQQIPELIFSAHVYSSNALQRSLVINGKFMEEGEPLNDKLTLSEITPRGAIFTIQEYRFSTSVIAGWN